MRALIPHTKRDRVANYGDGGTTAWRDLFLINSPWQMAPWTPPSRPLQPEEVWTTQGMRAVKELVAHLIGQIDHFREIMLFILVC